MEKISVQACRERSSRVLGNTCGHELRVGTSPYPLSHGRDPEEEGKGTGLRVQGLKVVLIASHENQLGKNLFNCS